MLGHTMVERINRQLSSEERTHFLLIHSSFFLFSFLALLFLNVTSIRPNNQSIEYSMAELVSDE